jgi:hypothetical protein
VRTRASSCSGPRSPCHSRRTPFGSTRLMPSGRDGALTRTKPPLFSSATASPSRPRRARMPFHE